MRVGFQTVGPDGRYNFTNIEPFAGENKFELNFYGPAGERRTENVTRYSGLTPDQPGSVRYQFSASQKGEQLYQGDDISNAGMSDRGSARFAGSMEVRVLPKLSLRGSWNNLVINGDRLNFTSLGATTAWRDITFGAEATHDPLTGTRWDGSIVLPAQKQLWGFDTRFSHTQYAQSVLIDDPLALPTYQLQLRSRTGLSLSGPIGGASTLFSLFHNRELDRSSNQVSAGFTKRLSKLTFGNTLNYYQFGRDSNGGTDPDRLDGDLFFSARTHPLSVRGGMSYLLKPEVDALQYFLDSNLTVAKDMTVNFGLTHFPSTGITRYTSGLNWQLPQVTLSPRVNYDSNGDYSGFIYAAFSLAPRPDSAGVIVSGRSLATSGTVVARVFLDNDESGTLSQDDEPVPDVTIRALQAFRTAKTDARGVAYMTGMSSERATDIVLSPESLPSTRMISTHAGNSVRPRPTAIKVVDFPVIPTGEIEGHVYKMQQGKRIPFPGAMVELRNSAGKVVAFKVSTHDGFFLFEDVPYATYTLDLTGRLLGKANLPKLVLGKARNEYTDIVIVVPETATSLSGASVLPPPVVKLPPALLPTGSTQAIQIVPKPNIAILDSTVAKSVADKPTDRRVVQIAAFADIEGARAHRLKLQSLDLLQDAQIDIVTVDLGAHGLFHRVVATPGSSSADALCSSLKMRGIECFTITP
jgi:outer membrane usher protein FimD/PapC